MTEQSRRTRSPRSALRTVVAAGRPPAETQALGAVVPVHPSTQTMVAAGRPPAKPQALGAVVPVHSSTPQLRRAMPRVPPMPGDSPGVPIDVDDLLAAAVESEFFYKPELDHYEAASNALRKEVSESSRNVATLVAELRASDHRARHIETVAVARCQGLQDEEHHRVLQESAALLRSSQNHEFEMASQRSGAVTMHTAIVAKQREEFNELVKQERAQMRVIREEAAYVSNNLAGQLAAEREKCYDLEIMAEQQFQTVNHGAANVTNHLAGQLAAERKRCHELEFMAEQQLQTTSHGYAVEVQRLRVANDLLAGELNLA